LADVEVNCVEPLALNPDIGSCQVACPGGKFQIIVSLSINATVFHSLLVHVWEGSFTDDLMVAMQVFGWLSLFASLMTIATWSVFLVLVHFGPGHSYFFLSCDIFDRYARYRSSDIGKLDTSVLCMSICCLIVAICFGPINLADWKKFTCLDGFTRVT
jgi:hypothetical protein